MADICVRGCVRCLSAHGQINIINNSIHLVLTGIAQAGASVLTIHNVSVITVLTRSLHLDVLAAHLRTHMRVKWKTW